MAGLMDLLGGDIVKTVGSVITDLVTTDKERMQLALQDKELEQKGDLAQIEVNKTEAATGKFWIGGWRPGVGWVGVLALFCAYVPKCLVLTAIWSYEALVLISHWNGVAPAPALPPFPDLGIMDIVGLLGSMLGVGFMRHRETMAGKARTSLDEPAAAPPGMPPNPYQQEAP